MPGTRLTACHDCDLLLQIPTTPAGSVTRCPRCAAELYRPPRYGPELTLSLAITALMVQIIANSFPVISLNLQGLVSSASLPETARLLIQHGFDTVGLMLFLCVVLAPTSVLACTIYLYAGLLGGRVLPAFNLLARLLFALPPWAMIEVMMLGIIVSVVKLRTHAEVYPEAGLWGTALFMLMFTALNARLDKHWLWSAYERLQTSTARDQTEPA